MVGLFGRNVTQIVVGVGAVGFGQVAHCLDKLHFDRLLEGWATGAVAGIGPIRPRSVRLELARIASRAEGIGGTSKPGSNMHAENGLPGSGLP